MDHGWWTAMSSLEHVYWIIAISASVVLAVQLVLVFVSGFDMNMGSDMAAHHGDSLDLPHFEILTIRNIVAFFAVFGWVGLALHNAGASTAVTILVSFACGLVMMVIMASMLLGLARLQTSGSLDVTTAAGQPAQTYLTIPAARNGIGKIEVIIQGKKVEMDAITDDLEPITTGSSVQVSQVINNKALVERKS